MSDLERPERKELEENTWSYQHPVSDKPTLNTSLADYDTVFIELPNVGMLQVGDYEDEEGITVNFVDHAEMRIEGEVKNNPKVTFGSREFPTRVEIDDREDAFTFVGE